MSVEEVPVLEPDDAGSYEPMARAVARHLRAAIIDGTLARGTPIRQEAVAQELGVSRIPVREALRELETEGLVTIRPHSGARVAVLERGNRRAGEAAVRTHIERSRLWLSQRRELFD